jgi:hypothetical protein
MAAFMTGSAAAGAARRRELAEAIAVLARARQDAVRDRTTALNRLRSPLREYFPGFLAAFAGARDGILMARGPDHPGRRTRPGPRRYSGTDRPRWR